MPNVSRLGQLVTRRQRRQLWEVGSTRGNTNIVWAQLLREQEANWAEKSTRSNEVCFVVAKSENAANTKRCTHGQGNEHHFAPSRNKMQWQRIICKRSVSCKSLQRLDVQLTVNALTSLCWGVGGWLCLDCEWSSPWAEAEHQRMHQPFKVLKCTAPCFSSTDTLAPSIGDARRTHWWIFIILDTCAFFTVNEAVLKQLLHQIINE